MIRSLGHRIFQPWWDAASERAAMRAVLREDDADLKSKLQEEQRQSSAASRRRRGQRAAAAVDGKTLRC